MSVHGLRIPMVAEKEILTKAFIEDLESFTVQDDTTGFLRPVICSVCDSIPSEPKWSCLVSAIEMKQLLSKCNMEAFFNVRFVSSMFVESVLHQSQRP